MAKCTCGGAQTIEHVTYMGNSSLLNYPYSNAYNLGWRNQPNFLWSNNKGETSRMLQYTAPERKQTLEETLNEFMKRTREQLRKNELAYQNNLASLKALEIQVFQLANSIVECDVGTLPSNLVKNPKEQVHAVGLVVEDEHSDYEEPITIESDPSIKELLVEESDAEAPKENQIEPNSKDSKSEDTGSTEHMFESEESVNQKQIEPSKVDTMEI